MRSLLHYLWPDTIAGARQLILRFPVTIEASKDGIKFTCSGDIGNGSVQLRQHTNVEKESENIDIELSEPVSLTFSLKYLVNFCKAAGLSSKVKICLSNEVPLLVSYQLSNPGSNLRFYLAPKVSQVYFPPYAGRHKWLRGMSRS